MAFPQDSSFQSISFDPNQPSWPVQAQQSMKPPASLSGPGEKKKQITRNRTSYSCKTCRKRKIKCDKVHPACGNCVKNQDRCEWSTSTAANSRGSSALPDSGSPEATRSAARGSTSHKRRKTDDGEYPSSEEPSPSPTAPASGGIEERLDRLTQLVEALSRGKHDEAAAHLESEFGLRKENSRSSRPSTVPNGRDNDSLRPVSSSGGVSPFTGSGVGDGRSQSPSYQFDIPTNASTETEIEDPLSKLNLGYLSIQEGGRTRYVGSTWFAFISDELDQLNVLLKDQNRYLSPTHIGNQECRDREDETPSSLSSGDSTTSDDQAQNSFHKISDRHHHKKAQLRDDCEACNFAATDRFMLFQAMDAHPSRFLRMSPDMVTGVPSEENSHVLFRCWLSGVHCCVPLLHPPAVLQKYNQFWAWYKEGRLKGLPLPEPDFLCLLYTIWYAGSVSISLKGFRRWFPGVSRASVSARFHDHATRCLTLMSFPRNASIYSVAALLMLQVIPAKEEEPLTMSLFVGLAIRVAQTMGLHREPSLFNITKWKAETRRRIFWLIFQLDSYAAITSGLPPMMDHDFFDTRPISELKDMLYGTEDGEKYEAEVAAGTRKPDDPDNPVTRQWTSHVSVIYLLAKARYEAAFATTRILKMHLGTKRITRDDMLTMRSILAKVDHDTNATIRRVPSKGIPELGFSPDQDEQGNYLVADYDLKHARSPSEDEIRPFIGLSPTEGLDNHTVRYHWNTLTAFYKFARIVMSMLVDKMYCISFLPLLKNAKSKFWEYARQCALRSCHGYMRKFIALATDRTFQPFYWSWPGTHQPMHATMIMLVDLYERPNSIEAPRSRAFIDKIFSMSTEEGGVVTGEDGVTIQRPLREGGREAWVLLRSLREKAWRKAGLDPNITWTEESQINAGVAQPLTETQQMAQNWREDVVNPQPLRSDQKAEPRQPTTSVPQNVNSTDFNNSGNSVSSIPQQQSAIPVFEQDTRNLTAPSFPPAQTLPSHYEIPVPVPAAMQTSGGYFSSAASVGASPYESVTRTTTTSQENATTNPATADSLRPDIHGVTPSNSTAPAPPHDEHHDADFWNRWDSILGSHSHLTFEDMMEDIKWDDLNGNHDDNMT